MASDSATSKISLFLIFLSLSIIFQWTSLHFGYKRYFFNAELLLSFFLISVNTRLLGTIVFFFAIFQEIFLGMTSIFYLFNYAQIKTIASFIFEAKITYLIALVICLGFISALLFAAIRVLKIFSWKRVLVFGILLSLVQATLSFRDGNFLQPSLMARKDLFFGSTSYFIQELQSINKQLFRLTSQENVEYQPIQYPSAAKLSIKENPEEKILFIIAESWGKPKDERVLEQQISFLRSSGNVKDLHLEKIHALGATIFGEFRELCGKTPTKLKFKNIPSDALADCMPASLYAKGYKTISLHGAHGTMYDRLQWYPAVGFHEMIFKEVLPISEKKECHSFPGYCDRYLFDIAAEKLASTSKTFLYWLTLNSHTPYDRRDIIEYDTNKCQSAFGESYVDQLCTYHQLHSQFFKGLSEMIKNEKLKGLKVIVVGDHAPIFNDESSRQQFEPDEVPMMYFTVQ